MDRTRIECGMGCRWAVPYGFVPEADCPVHDVREWKPPQFENQGHYELWRLGIPPENWDNLIKIAQDAVMLNIGVSTFTNFIAGIARLQQRFDTLAETIYWFNARRNRYRLKVQFFALLSLILLVVYYGAGY
jgi:hypothetical protein